MLAAIMAVAVAATPARVTLQHSAPPQCPDAEWMMGNVTARLGQSPFGPDAASTAVTRIECSAAGCQGSLELTSPSGPPRRRTLTSPADQCRELAESLALAIALVVDPQLLARPAPSPPPPEPPPEAAPSEAPPPPAPPPPATAVALQGTLALHVALGLSPSPTAGAALGVGLRKGAFGLLAEGRVDLPSGVAVATGRVTSQVLLASVLPCGYFKDVGACLQLAAGALQVSGDLPGGNRRTSPLLLIGGRLVYEHLFLPWLGLHAHLTVSGVPLRTTVVAGGAVVWVTSLVSSELAAGAVVRF